MRPPSTLRMYQKSTNTKTSLTGFVDFDEPYLDHGGEYVFLVQNLNPWPQEQLNTIVKLSDMTTDDGTGAGNFVKMGHAASLYGYIASRDVDGSAPTSNFRVRLSDHSQSLINNTGGSVGTHNSGNWMQPNVPRLEQYYMIGIDAGNVDFPNGMALNRLDGTDTRLIAHQYANKYGGNSYFRVPHATISGNGLLVMWTGDMNNPGGETDLFVAELPGK